jgi:SAM-dependent methyltransferase
MAEESSQIAETRQTYDQIWSEFASRNSIPAAAVAERLEQLAWSLPAGSLVADIGCGPGRDALLMRAHGLHVIGVDLSIGQLRAGNVPGLVQADMRCLPLRTGSVDAIWCNAALLHIPREAVPEVLTEFGRILRGGGGLWLSVVEGDGEGFEVASNYGSDRRRWFTLHREPELTALLAAAGFSVREVTRQHAGRDFLSLQAVTNQCTPGW